MISYLTLLSDSTQGGDAVEFRRVNDAYKRLIAHTVTMEAIDAETDLCSTSVVIEVSKQSVPKGRRHPPHIMSTQKFFRFEPLPPVRKK